MSNLPDFSFCKRPEWWLGGEPRTFTIDAEDDFVRKFDLQGADLLTIDYQGGGIGKLFDCVAEAAQVSGTSFQALLENLGDLSDRKPLVLLIRHGDQLLADVGPALLHIMAAWESFARHGTGVHPMYLVVETGPRATVNAAFYPGGKVKWPG